MSERDVTTRDGRTLRISDDGPRDGVPILALSGTPGSRRLSGRAVAEAHERGIRLISHDRPGYGGSTRLEGRNVAACAGDVRSIAEALGIERLGVWGISGGGPHAAACAGLLDGIVGAVAVLASVAPYGAPGLDWTAGMGEDNVAEFQAALQGPIACRPLLEEMRDQILDSDPGATAEMMRTLLSAVDAAALTDELSAQVSASMATGLADGVDGWLDDDLAFTRDWGFGLSQIRVPVLVLHGRQDRFVPVAHGEWLAAAIPGAQARIFDDEGHISLGENRIAETYDWLLEALSAGRAGG